MYLGKPFGARVREMIGREDEATQRRGGGGGNVGKGGCDEASLQL